MIWTTLSIERPSSPTFWTPYSFRAALPVRRLIWLAAWNCRRRRQEEERFQVLRHRYGLSASLCGRGVLLTWNSLRLDPVVAGGMFSSPPRSSFSAGFSGEDERGARLGRGIEGLAMYLERRSATASPAQSSGGDPGAFEKLLPYALPWERAKHGRTASATSLKTGEIRSGLEGNHACRGLRQAAFTCRFAEALAQNVRSSAASYSPPSSTGSSGSSSYREAAERAAGDPPAEAAEAEAAGKGSGPSAMKDGGIR